MTKKKMNIWGRDFELSVYFGCYEGEEILDVQREALREILDNPAAIQNAKKDVEEYILEWNSYDLPNGKVDNIFRYVIPTAIFMPYFRNARRAAILCNYRFDPEHGIAILFENGKLLEVCSEDCVM